MIVLIMANIINCDDDCGSSDDAGCGNAEENVVVVVVTIDGNVLFIYILFIYRWGVIVALTQVVILQIENSMMHR